MTYTEACNCNLCGTKLQRDNSPSIHGKFTMCQDCANINRSLLVRHSLLLYGTNVYGSFTWMALDSITKLKQLFPNPLSEDEDFFIPAPDSGGAGDGDDTIPPTLRAPNVEEDIAYMQRKMKHALGVSEVCKLHYYGVGPCSCNKG